MRGPFFAQVVAQSSAITIPYCVPPTIQDLLSNDQRRERSLTTAIASNGINREVL